MFTRLHSVDPDLAEDFLASSSTLQIESAIAACRVALELVGLRNDPVENALNHFDSPQKVTQGQQMLVLSKKLDQKYFELDEAGQTDQAMAYFSQARAVSALSQTLLSTTPEELHEAVYEAICAIENQAVAETVSEILRRNA